MNRKAGDFFVKINLQIFFLIDKPGSCNAECNEIDCQDQDTEVIDSTAGSNGTDQMTGL